MAWFYLGYGLVWSCLCLGLVLSRSLLGFFSVSWFFLGLGVVVHGSWIDPSLGQNY